MNKLYTIFAIVFSVFLGEVTYGTFDRRELPESATIDANNANDAALVRAFGGEEKASLWKKLGVHFRKGEVNFFTRTDLYKYSRTNSDLIKSPRRQLVLEDAEALMYFLFPRVSNRNMSIDEVNKILNISEERMVVVERRWQRFRTWAELPVRCPTFLLRRRVSVPEDPQEETDSEPSSFGSKASRHE